MRENIWICSLSKIFPYLFIFICFGNLILQSSKSNFAIRRLAKPIAQVLSSTEPQVNPILKQSQNLQFESQEQLLRDRQQQFQERYQQQWNQRQQEWKNKNRIQQLENQQRQNLERVRQENDFRRQQEINRHRRELIIHPPKIEQ